MNLRKTISNVVKNNESLSLDNKKDSEHLTNALWSHIRFELENYFEFIMDDIGGVKSDD